MNVLILQQCVLFKKKMFTFIFFVSVYTISSWNLTKNLTKISEIVFRFRDVSLKSK